MGALEKAKLQEVSADEHERILKPAVPVQFNPSSLKLKLTNQMEGGRSTGRVRRQQSGAGNTVLTMELVFDTADEGDDANPVSVRTKTAIVERYVVPNSDNSQTPPRLRFEWNDLVVSGLVESVNIDFDLFASNGTPLRAKVNLSIKEQEPKYQLKSSDNATQPGAASADSAASDQSAPALDGETPAEFAARNGLDPSAWRGLDVDLSAGLSLSAGLEVGFSAGLSVSAGIGVSVGVQAGVDVSLEAALGLSVDAKVGTSATASVGGLSTSSAGLALSSAGGVAAAIETVKVANSTAAAEQAKQSFGQTNASAGGSSLVGRVDSNTNTVAAQSIKADSRQSHTPLVTSGPRSVTQQRNAESAPAPPMADPRAISFGAGVPLRPVIKSANEQQRPRVGATSTRRGIDGPPISSDPATPAWEALPRRGVVRSPASRLGGKRSSRSNACGCKGGKA
jgi:hypothetical protein